MLKRLWMVPVLLLAAGGLCVAGQQRGAIVQPPAETPTPAPEAAKPPVADVAPPAAVTAAAPAKTDAATKPDADSGPSQPVRNFVAISKAIQEFVTGIAGAFLTIPLIALAILILFRRQANALLQAIIDATADRGVTLDVGTAFKVAVTEPQQDAVADVRPIYSLSPFVIDDEPPDAAPILERIAPQLTFHSSDSVAEYWERHWHQQPAVAQMRVNLAALTAASAVSGASFAALRPALITYVRSLEDARFREAGKFAQLLDSCPVLLAGLQQLTPSALAGPNDEFVALHAAGVAFAQSINRWDASFAWLERIAWKGGHPLYPPAGSMWVAAAYHARLAATLSANPAASLDSSEVVAKVDGLLDRGELLLDALTTWSGAGALRGYYLRECHKDLGDVASIFAEHLPAGADRDRLMACGRSHLEQCVETLGGTEPPTPLDHNNLADLYRQLGDDARSVGNDVVARSCYRLAHEQMDMAFAPARPGDPAFHNTMALLLHSERKTGAACRVLAEYAFERARDRTAQEIEEYFDNQVLAAKLLVAQHAGQPALGLTAAVDVLRRGVHDLGSIEARLDFDTARRLEAQMQELLGFAYLQSPRCEGAAVSAFDQLVSLLVAERDPETAFRADLGAATALGRYARVQRRQYTTATASRLCERAEPHLAAVLERIKSMKIGTEPMAADLREHHLRAWLDSLRAAQFLAEEWFSVRADRKADDLAKAIVEPLAALNEAVRPLAQAAGVPDAGGAPDGMLEKREATRRVAARHSLLTARLMIRADATLKAADLPVNVEQALAGARGISPQFNCEADLELGALLLDVARLGTGDPARDYLMAVAAFERAAEADAPAMRGEVVRQLAYAYAMRAVILRRKPAAAKKSAAE